MMSNTNRQQINNSMKRIKELQLIIKMNERLGVATDQAVYDEIASEELKEQRILDLQEERKRAFKSTFSDLSKEINKLVAEEKQKTEEEQALLDRFANVLTKIDEIRDASTSNPQVTIAEDSVEGQQEDVLEVVAEAAAILAPIEQPSLAREAAKKIAKDAPPSMFVQPDPAVTGRDLQSIQNKLKLLEGWVSKIAASGPGGGEVLFRYLDDVNRNTMTAPNNNWVLEYDAVSKKVQFTDEIGPISSVMFDPNHNSSIHQHPVGTTCWDLDDRTLNIIHPDGVIQQVGQELYFLVRNNTGSTITNGMFCGFAGAVGTDGEARLLAAPFIANGTQRNLYGMGVATQDIPHGSEGFVTAFGKVRDLNTTGTPVGEAWQLGDVLYAHPSIAGALTRVKPTAPNNVLPVGALVQLSATVGEIFIRPTIEQRAPYARFSDTTTQAANAINTPYAVTFNTTDIAREFTRGTPTSRIIAEVSGLYLYNFTLQIASSSASKKEVWIWARKNGVDVPNSASRISITGNDEYKVVGWGFEISMMDGDYFELMWAVSDTAVSVVAPPQPSFCPAVPSSTLIVTMAAL